MQTSRQHHAELWEFAPQKAIQLRNLYCRETPCAGCGALFLTHSCPTWTQLAVLLVNGAGLQAPDELPAPEVAHRCELCLENFGDTAQLVQHLQQAHSLHGLSFNVSRDSIEHTSACTHCGLIFQTMAGLKTHIVQGRCLHFNPQAATETQEVLDMWKAACLDGQMLEVLRVPANRMRLTVSCQACGKNCMRAADLSLHLQTSHARLWRQSQRLTMVMVDAFYKHQCFCNPSVGIKRGHHICLPFRQLAMCFLRLGQEPFAPTVVTDQVLLHALSNQLPRHEKHALERILVNRQFSALWQDLDMLQFLSWHCLQCGKTLRPADLVLHLREEHFCRHEMILFYMEQLLPHVHAMNPEDFRCQLCRQFATEHETG